MGTIVMSYDDYGIYGMDGMGGWGKWDGKLRSSDRAADSAGHHDGRKQATRVLMAFRAHAGEVIRVSCLRVAKDLHMCNEYWICASDCLN